MYNLSLFKDNLHDLVNIYCDIAQKKMKNDDEHDNMNMEYY